MSDIGHRLAEAYKKALDTMHNLMQPLDTSKMGLSKTQGGKSKAGDEAIEALNEGDDAASDAGIEKVKN